MPTNSQHPHACEQLVLVDEYGADPDAGISHDLAEQRLAEYGPNELPSSRGPSVVRVFLTQFRNPLIYVLLGSAAITLVIGHAVDSIVIMAVVLVNAIVGFMQEWRAGVALAALAEMSPTTASVIRESQPIRIPSTHLVPGDVVIIDAGDRIPADLRLLHTADLRVDEANLTGESVPVHKHPDPVPADTALADRTNMAYSGTLSTAGRGVGLVVDTGPRTEMGRIHQLMSAAEGVETPLTKKLTQFSRWLTVAILGLAAIAFILGLTRGEDPADMVTAAVALAVGAIPEGLPAAVTITLAIGVGRMARRNAIVRRLPAVETLGSTTVICTDKTGTLTENQMTVQHIFAEGETHSLSGREHEQTPVVRECLLAGLLCNDASIGSSFHNREDNIGDPTELALVAAARIDDHVWTEARSWTRVQEIPFSSDIRLMATLHSNIDGSRYRVFVKGAVEDVLALCEIEPKERDQIAQVADHFGDQALRVMAFASKSVNPNFNLTLLSLRENSLQFLGLQALMDPPRSEAIQAIRACHTAGVNVKMITGDHQHTAEAIAHQIGLNPRHDAPLIVLSGRDLERVEKGDLQSTINSADVFARVTAEQKLEIVCALQSGGNVVAMTGDGVNDAPALKQADIGVAMGLIGTEVAKETADIVLTDDDFATIEAAVEEGRGVFDNLTKFIAWTLPTNLGEGLVILAAIMLGTSLPILPVQILWINMTTAVALGLMLAFEPKEADIMKRPPRAPDNQIVTGQLIVRIIAVGAAMLIGSFGLFTAAVDAGASTAEARTLAVNAFVAMEIGYLFNCRSLHGSVWKVGWFTNPWIWVGIGTTVALQMAFTYLPIMNSIFQSAPLAASAWWPIIALGLVINLVIGAIKWVENRRTVVVVGASR